MPPIDFDKLLDQEPKFKAYCMEACLKMLLSDKQNMGGFMSTMYSFYNMGMTMQQVETWISSMKGFGDSNGDHNPERR